MTEEHDKPLDRFFHAAYVELPEEEFTSGVMDHVRRYERRSAIYRNVTCFGVLVIALVLAPFIQSGSLLISVFPGEATLLASGLALAQSPLLFILGLAATGYFLLNSEY